MYTELVKTAHFVALEPVFGESEPTDNIEQPDHDVLYDTIRQGDLERTLQLMADGVVLKSNDYTPFMLACFYGHLDLVQALYSDNALNERDVYGNTPLIHAAWNGHTEVVQWLVREGADANAVNISADSALFVALRFKHPDTARYLLTLKNIKTDKPNSLSYTPLVIALVYGYLDIVDILYNQNVVLNTQYTENNTLLHMCAMINNLSSMQWLLEHDANPWVSNSHHMTPVRIAASRGYTEMVGILIAKMKHHHLFSEELEHVLLAAVSQGHEDILDLVLTHKKQFSSIMIQVALLHSTITNNWNMVSRVLDINPEKALKRINKHYDYGDFEYNFGNTLLHSAAVNGHLLMVQNLIARGAKTNARNDNNDSILHCAVRSGNIDLVRWLCHQYVPVNQQNEQGNTPLHLAVKMKNTSMVRCLLLYGARFNSENKHKNTAEFLAKGTPELEQLFQEMRTKDLNSFGLTDLHLAATIHEEKALLQILPLHHDFSLTSEDGLTPIEIAAHMGNSGTLAIMLLWEAKGDRNAAKILAKEMKGHYEAKSSMYLGITNAIKSIDSFPAHRLDALITLYNSCQKVNVDTKSEPVQDERKVNHSSSRWRGFFCIDAASASSISKELVEETVNDFTTKH
ncbi:Ankyrin repeat protein [Legionella moravica]|uniref:Ankyrin repeat protein n=1 Tax=Legionella moravica TaxID=39962 RepID=A0A378K2C9_9GAMM|nr:ankyrin repeat domain-containing protein [Legionella moravica]KTD34903.1 Ankyrin repeat protein [Legionella moravica]STX63852.1 Ankyrin repeat protein [Legionella moravica]